MERVKMDGMCQVCHDSAKGSHFGVLVCSACSAFFRRTVVKDQKYKCSGTESCEVVSTIRNICKSCRFSKCLAVGMRKEGVQRYRDSYGKREKPEDVQSTSSEPSPSPSGYLFPVLNGVVKNYVLLENLRQVIHRDEQQSVFVKREPRRLNYKETVNVFLKETHLLEDWIRNSFLDFARLPAEQKEILMSNFRHQFVLLEGGYFSCRQDRFDITYLPSGDYIDCVHPESYYFDPDGLQPISANDAAKMFASSFANYRRNVYDPMRRDSVDCVEFLALAALTLFDTGLEDQSDECVETCREVRIKIQKELSQYCQLKSDKEEEATIRLGNMLSILPNLQRAARRLQEDMTLSNVWNAYSVDQKFYNLGKF